MKALAVWTLAIVLGVTACRGEHRPARVLYNQGVAALATGDFEAAEKLFLDARSTAGVDPELRFRAAYDLGVALAAHADKVRSAEQPDLAKALELAQQSASWLADAARLRKDDKDTQANLAIVRARVQSISDELREAEGKLEARLDKLIEEQRDVLDGARGAWFEIKQSGGADPLAQQTNLTHLADRERGIVAETGVLQDISGDEIDTIGKKPEDKRTDEERVRLIQLKNLDLYLLDARNAIADARRKLQELAAEDGVVRAEAALVALKRGREQLLDPITVMRNVAQDQTGVLRETMVAAASDGSLQIHVEQQLPPPDQMPGWLAPAAIAHRQNGLRDRIEEVRARLEAATSQPPPDPSTLQDPKAQQQAAQQAELLARVKVALPSVAEASGEMGKAIQSLRSAKAKPAIDHERAALLALMKAIEQFSDLKQLIELAYGDQRALVELLGPEAAKRLPPDERATETRGALERNLARMPRLKELIAEQLANAEKVPPPSDPANDPDAAKAAEAHKAQIEQAKQQLAMAESLRAGAETALQNLGKAIVANGDPVAPAKDGEQKLAELRKLFFNIIEHLQQLIRDQGDTIDRTTQANVEDMFGREAKLPDLVSTQARHGDLAKAITEALAAQADAAGKDGAKPQPGQPDAKTYAAAANEVRQAQQEMADATRVLTTARDDKQKSHSLEPATKSQDKANEHLKKALELLQPPQKSKDNKQQQQQEPKPQPEEPKPQGGAQQRVRDEDARRQKERQQQQPQSGTEVMDW
ncbi:MAG: hypothetical protein ACKV2T_06705 [Kofleriaceae bacterium]